jgi:hypothetical protein
MSDSEWLELLCTHVGPLRTIDAQMRLVLEPQPWYAQGGGRSRGGGVRLCHRSLGRVREPRQGRLARRIRKVYESDTLECPKCKGPIRSIALIEDPAVVRAILTHLRLGQPEGLERAPPPPTGRLAGARQSAAHVSPAIDVP